MKNFLTLCLALIAFGLGMQEMSAQTNIKKTEKNTNISAHDFAKSLNLDHKTTKSFLKVLEKHYKTLEQNKHEKNIEELRKKTRMSTDKQMTELLTKEQFAKLKKTKLY